MKQHIMDSFLTSDKQTSPQEYEVLVENRKPCTHIVAPSILSGNFLHLSKDIELVNDSVAQWLHIDVMDGVFVPNISFGMPVLKAIQGICNKVLDVHLMIVQPDKYIQDFAKLGANVLTVHYEVCQHLHRTIQTIRDCGMQVGVAINPHTNIELLQDVIMDIDVVCIMSVNPGFGGQKFIQNTYIKIQKLCRMIQILGANCKIQIDGGVTLDNASKILDAGAHILVAGNTVFGSKNPKETIHKLFNT